MNEEGGQNGPGAAAPAAVSERSVLVLAHKAVAVIDALGFKEISRTHSSAALTSVLKTARQYIQRHSEFHNVVERTNVHSAMFSDTAIFAAEAEEQPTALWVLADQVSNFLIRASGSTPPLIYRGCVSAGELTVDDDIFVGESLNEAGEWHEQADAAIVWLTPRAVRLSGLRSGELPWFFDWSVPLKNGTHIETLVVNPLWAQIEPLGFGAVDTLIRRLLAPFDSSDRIDVVRKRQMTEAFLTAANAYSKRMAAEHHAHSLYQQLGLVEGDSR